VTTPAPPKDVPALLRALLEDDPGRPRLTWYGPDSERVELSAKVLDNWVAKTANLLVDELDAGPGVRVGIALPPHWRTATWLLATWCTGACAVVDEAVTLDAEVDVLVATDPAALAIAAGRPSVAVALPALATSFGPGLPSGAIDAAVDVRAHGDVFVPFVHPTPQDPAFEWAGGALPHGELLTVAARAADDARLAPRVRLLTGGAPKRAVTDLLAPLVRLGSVVLHHHLAALEADPSALLALRRQEGITAPP
jgi:uncharacterized protein (TIGR03089 family)